MSKRRLALRAGFAGLCMMALGAVGFLAGFGLIPLALIPLGTLCVSVSFLVWDREHSVPRLTPRGEARARVERAKERDVDVFTPTKKGVDA